MGRLIGPKTWDRIYSRFLEPRCIRSCFRGLFGCGLCNLCVRCLLGMHWAGNGRGLRVH